MLDCELLSRTCGVLFGGEFESEDDMVAGGEEEEGGSGRREEEMTSQCWSSLSSE